MQQDEYLQVNNSNRKPDYKGSISPTPDCYLLHVQDGKIAEIGLNDYIDFLRASLSVRKNLMLNISASRYNNFMMTSKRLTEI